MPAGVGDVALPRRSVSVDAHEHGRGAGPTATLERELLGGLLHKRHVVDLDAGVARHIVSCIEVASAVRILDVGVLVERFDGTAGDEPVAGVEIAVAVLEACHAAFDRRGERKHGRTVLVELHTVDAGLGALLVVAVFVRRETEEQHRPVGLGRVERPAFGKGGFRLNRSVRRGKREMPAGAVKHSRVAREIERNRRTGQLIHRAVVVSVAHLEHEVRRVLAPEDRRNAGVRAVTTEDART